MEQQLQQDQDSNEQGSTQQKKSKFQQSQQEIIDKDQEKSNHDDQSAHHNSDNEDEQIDENKQSNKDQSDNEDEKDNELTTFKTHYCQQHDKNESKFLCIDNNCQNQNRVACSECIADGPHKLHQNKKIKEVQRELQFIYEQYQQAQAKEEKFKTLKTITYQKEIDYEQNMKSTFDNIRSKFIKQLDQIEEKYYDQIQKHMKSEKGKTAKLQQTLSNMKQSQNNSFEMDTQDTPYTLINNLDQPGKSSLAIKIIQQNNYKLFDPSYQSQTLGNNNINYNRQRQLDNEIINKSLSNIEQNINTFLEKELNKYFIAPDFGQKKSKSPSPVRSKRESLQSQEQVDQLMEKQVNQISLTQKAVNISIQKKGPFKINTFQGVKNYQFIGHQDQIIVLLALDDYTFVSASKDKSLRVWDIKQNKCIQRLEGHTGYVQSIIQLAPYIIATGGGMSDKSIKIWDLQKNQCIQVLSGHESGITALLQLDECGIASASQDKTLMFWNWKKLIILKTIVKIHIDTIVTMYLEEGGKNMLTCSLDRTIKMWSIKFGDCLKVFNIDKKYQTLTRINSNYFALGSDKDILILNTIDWSIDNCLKGHKKPIRKICVIDEDIIATGAGDKQIRIWDWIEGKCLQVIEGHVEGVTALERLNQNVIISGGEDKRIIIWN